MSLLKDNVFGYIDVYPNFSHWHSLRMQKRSFVMKSRIVMLASAVVIAVGLAGFVGCSSSTEATTAEVKLPTMQCGSCESTISTAMKAVDGVKDVKIDMASKTAHVSFVGNQATIAKIEDAVAKSGYAANDKKADPKAYAKLAECCKVDGQ
ncbi:MAG: mercuric ion binding protein [Candidatus Latescibacterota bacterium]|jgi:mercuric ion binding protein